MGLSPQLITESLYKKAVQELKSLSKENREAIRHRAIVSAKEHGVGVTAKVFGVNGNTIRAWVKKFIAGGASNLSYVIGRGRRSNLSDIHYEAIARWTKEDGNITILKITLKLKEEFKIKTSKSAVHRALKWLNLSYITPRPVHHKQDKALQEEFKKNLIQEITNNPDKELFFFDESRFGTHSKLGHGWFSRGIRTVVKVKLGFQNFYVYSAVNVLNGKDFSLIIPNLKTEFMNVFLAEFSKDLGEKSALMVMDQAAWHKSKDLIIPNNIQIMFLPPYSPELNLVEKLWQYIKSHTIKNKIYDSLDSLELAICDFFRNIDPSTIAKTCSINYLC